MKKLGKFAGKAMMITVYIYMAILVAIMAMATICGDGNRGIIDLFR